MNILQWFKIAQVIFRTNGFYGVVVSTLDFESSDLGSTPGRTYVSFLAIYYSIIIIFWFSLSI